MSQTGQLALELGTRAAEERAAEWCGFARWWMHRLAPGDVFSADTLRTNIGDPPAHGDAMGSVLRNARKAGLIRPIGHVTSTRPDRHGATIRLWERC